MRPGRSGRPDLGAGDRRAAVHHEDPAHLGAALVDLDEGGLVHPPDRGGDVIGDPVDDVVEAYVDPELLGRRPGVIVGPHVKADHNGIGDRGEVDVEFGDGPYALADDDDLHVGVLEIDDLSPQRLQGSVGLGLEHQVQGLGLPLDGGEVGQGDAPGRLSQAGPALGGALLGETPGRLLRLHDLEHVAGGGHVGEPCDLHRLAGSRRSDLLRRHRSALDHRVHLPDHHVVAHPERPVLDQDGRHRAPPRSSSESMTVPTAGRFGLARG